MLSKELAAKSVEELAPLLKNKTISPVELTEAVLNQAEQTQDTINAYIDIYREDALNKAKEAEQEITSGNYRGMYHVIPMGIKDIFYMKNKVITPSLGQQPI